ncbi:MAG: antiviral reverse transcriptase Drt3b [Desulfovibrionaceae bacterium]
MSKHHINSKNKNHALLTDTLPYETLISFSNEGLYEYINGSRKNKNLEKLLETTSPTVPYSYKINKDSKSKRTISIPHPSVQKDIVKLYEDYDSLIIHLCNRSDFSIRRPHKVASAFYEKASNEHDTFSERSVEEDSAIESLQHKFASSYFSYRTYNFIYKFYDSYEYHRLEKRFKYNYIFDIQKCFPSIYTHSIAWAVKDKAYAKKLKTSASFEKYFDSCMQRSNDAETNGILIGPEFSRIFAEIILQRIDCNVLKETEERGLTYRVDFAIRRYMDDHFVFYNDSNVLEVIMELYLKYLEDYKLYINESKCITLERPFMTEISSCKMAVKDFLAWFTRTIFSLSPDTDEQISFSENIKVQSSFADSCIARYKAILKKYDIGYDALCRLTMSTLCEKTIFFVNKFKTKSPNTDESEVIKQRLWIMLDFVFFAYSMSVTARSTHVISRAIFYINKCCNCLQRHDADDVRKKIFDECNQVISINNACNPRPSVEICNLLITMSSLDSYLQIEKDNLLNIFKVDKMYSVEHLDYFAIVTLLFCINSRSGFSKLKQSIKNSILSRIKTSGSLIASTENVLLLLDTISCDYLQISQRREIADETMNKLSASANIQDKNTFFNFVSNKQWFMDWKAAEDFDEILAKKELRTPY